MKLLSRSWFVILILVLAHLFQFWPFYFQRLLPFPGDMLVAFYFPWSGGGFAGFDPWTQYKALNTVDVIKQFYPWKDFAFNLLRQGIWPLWNPYSFSGMPFIANLQSGIFFPLNLFYFFVPVLWGWVGNVLFQLLLFGTFFYLFLRSEKLSRLSSAFGAVVGMNLSYIVLWHWQLVITQSLLFLPLILYLVNRRKLLLASIFLAFSLLGGHAQTNIYVYVIFIFFALFRRVPFWKITLVSIFSVFLAAVQLFPSAQAYLLSAREGAATKELFAPFVFHWRHITSVLVPDFFGHPTTRNYFGKDYRDMSAYFGITAFVFSLLSISWIKINSSVKFFAFMAIFGLLFAAWPLVFIFDIFNIPVLSSGVPARMIFLFQFGGGVLAAFGFEYWLQIKSKFDRNIIIVSTILAGAMVILSVIAVGDRWLTRTVSRNSVILPLIFFSFTIAALFLAKIRPKLNWLAVIVIFTLPFFQYSYFFNKYNSFAPLKFIFPQHPALSFLQKNGGINRFFGTENAIFNYNFSVYYRLFDFEGYDSMYPKRYGELVASVVDGKIPQVVPRSDAYINNWSSSHSERFLDIVGVKYLLDKNELVTSDWEPEPSRFDPQKYRLVWQIRPWRIFERQSALPRIGLFDNLTIETDKQRIISKLYDASFDYHSTLVLEQTPAIIPQKTKNKNARLISYQPNRISLETTADQPQLLYLSDNFYPGWKALVDEKEQEILRANYTFRAVPIPAGEHKIIFEYDPVPFKLGLSVSVLSFVFVGGFLLWRRKF